MNSASYPRVMPGGLIHCLSVDSNSGFLVISWNAGLMIYDDINDLLCFGIPRYPHAVILSDAN